jgi:hypothetical protein
MDNSYLYSVPTNQMQAVGISISIMKSKEEDNNLLILFAAFASQIKHDNII